MKKNGFTTLLKATAVVASIGGLAYLYKDKISEGISSLKGLFSKEDDDIFEDDIFETEDDDNSADAGTREYVSLDIEQPKKAAEELEEEMTLQEMETAIEEEIQLENELEDAETAVEEETIAEEEMTPEDAVEETKEAVEEEISDTEE